jgi:hypothetical protein
VIRSPLQVLVNILQNVRKRREYTVVDISSRGSPRKMRISTLYSNGTSPTRIVGDGKPRQVCARPRGLLGVWSSSGALSPEAAAVLAKLDRAFHMEETKGCFTVGKM